MRQLVIATLLLPFLSACATMPIPREPSKVSLETKKTQAEVFKAVSRALISAGYAIKTSNTEAGLITIEPTAFNYKRGMGFVFPGRSSAQVAVETGKVIITITHECGINNPYAGSSTSYEHCNKGDAIEPTKAQEDAFVNALKPAL